MIAVTTGLVAVMGILPAAAQTTPSASRSFNPASVDPGGRVVVTIAASNYGLAGGVTETLPAGFSYVSSSLDEAQVNVSGQQARFTLQGDTSFTYTVTASSTPGPYDFTGTLRDADRNDHTVGGASSVTVNTPPAASASRSFNSASVDPGGRVVVTITASNYGLAGGVTETLPAGFSYVSSSLDAAQVNVSGQQARFTLQGDTSFTYTVTASSTPGPYDFSGTLRDADRNDHTVGGASSVTVNTPPAASASRSFAPSSVDPGGRVVVTITASNYGLAGGVTETLPAGFSYVSSSLDDAQVNVSGQQARFTLQGDTSFTYTVTASNTPGPHTFSGTLRDADRNDSPVGGASRVTVNTPPGQVTPSASRSFNPASVDPGGRVVVTIAASNYGLAGGVTETLPAGFSYLSSNLDDAQVNVSGQQARFTLQGDTSFTYTVIASSTPGPYVFSGTLRDADRTDHTVGGSTRVTVRRRGGGGGEPPIAPANQAPAFEEGNSASRSSPENSPSGTSVGNPVTATDRDGDKITYGITGGHSGLFHIVPATGQITVGAGTALDYETTISYSFTARAQDSGGFSDTINVTINVTNVDEDGTVTITPEEPHVDEDLNASLSDPDGSESGVTWQWARSDAMDGTYAAIGNATAALYTPVVDDVDMYLRATAGYTDGHGPNKTAMATTTMMVTDERAVEERYDANGNGTIEKSEVIAAIRDYFDDEALTKAQVIKLIQLYFSS